MSEPFIAPEGAMQFELKAIGGGSRFAALSEPACIWVTGPVERLPSLICAVDGCTCDHFYRIVVEGLPPEWRDETTARQKGPVVCKCFGHLIE